MPKINTDLHVNIQKYNEIIKRQFQETRPEMKLRMHRVLLYDSETWVLKYQNKKTETS
jgi:hypothetical protein